ncbi:MAG: integrase [Chloroflexi bacterium]|nr:integrase [Chloroflexota bacterium]
MAKAYLDISDVQKLEAAATNLRDELLICLLFRTGSRISEVLGLTVGDIDFTTGTITIVHLKTRVKFSCPNCDTRLGRNHSYCPRCGHKVSEAVLKEQKHRRTRVIPLDDKSLGLLKEYIRRGGPVKRDGEQVIFGINRHRAYQIIRACAEKAGLPKLKNPETGQVHNVSPHRLRDAFAVHAMKHDYSGDGLRLPQEHLGHASFNTTAKYRKVAGQELKQWYNKLWDEGTKPDGP